MSVSDDSTPAPRDWLAIRKQYETGSMSQRNLADSLGISQSTLMRRAMREKWMQRSKLVRLAASDLEAKLARSVKSAVEDELAPFIEAHKARITKRAVKMSNRGLSRLDSLWKQQKPSQAKQEAEAAKTLETLVRVARTSLGMGDGSPVGSVVSLNILTNQAAVQVNPAGPIESQS
jgi:hypothetical protein